MESLMSGLISKKVVTHDKEELIEAILILNDLSNINMSDLKKLLDLDTL